MGKSINYSRKENVKKERRILQIVSEGRDEIKYFRRRIERYSNLNFKFSRAARATDPNNLVETALSKVRDLDIKNGDMVWCLFDVDHHTDKEIKKAIENAGNTVNVCLSNPCFDLWILLHFDDCVSKLSHKHAKAKVKIHLPNYSKTESFDKLKRRNRQKAILRAKKLNQMHKQNNVELLSRKSNPSTQVFEVVEYLDKIISENRKKQDEFF